MMLTWQALATEFAEWVDHHSVWFGIGLVIFGMLFGSILRSISLPDEGRVRQLIHEELNKR